MKTCIANRIIGIFFFLLIFPIITLISFYYSLYKLRKIYLIKDIINHLKDYEWAIHRNLYIPKSEDETKKALKEKLASFSEEEINTLKSQLVGSNREDLDKLLDEIAQERNNEYPPEDTHKNYMMNENLNYANKSSINYSENYDPIYDPMSHLGQQIENNPNGEEEMKDNYPLESNEFEKDGTDYMSKVWKLQGFINKNGLFFIQYAQNLEFEQPYQIM